MLQWYETYGNCNYGITEWKLNVEVGRSQIIKKKKCAQENRWWDKLGKIALTSAVTFQEKSGNIQDQYLKGQESQTSSLLSWYQIS